MYPSFVKFRPNSFSLIVFILLKIFTNNIALSYFIAQIVAQVLDFWLGAFLLCDVFIWLSIHRMSTIIGQLYTLSVAKRNRLDIHFPLSLEVKTLNLDTTSWSDCRQLSRSFNTLKEN